MYIYWADAFLTVWLHYHLSADMLTQLLKNYCTFLVFLRIFPKSAVKHNQPTVGYQQFKITFEYNLKIFITLLSRLLLYLALTYTINYL